MKAADSVHEWEAAGSRVTVGDHAVWMLDLPARTTASTEREPLLALHGFPTCSYDWRPVLDELRTDRRFVTLDFLGFGLSDKPDRRYGIRMHADVVEGVAAALGLRSVALLTHDMGNSVGGELLARALDGTLDFEITRRVLTNGSIYIDMAHLTAGQQMLLAVDDKPTDLVSGDAFKTGVARTYSPATTVDEDELDAQWLLASRRDGHRLLSRTIRYIEDRRTEERRYTGAIETHPSPLGVVWGADDPVAVLPMTDTLHAARPDAPITVLDGVGHYPMVESPERFAAAVLGDLT
jgi:pimeloyl-ACP methyl ester carboxylesterase